jgi:hypothetical protein
VSVMVSGLRASSPRAASGLQCLCLATAALIENVPMIARRSQRAAGRARWPELVRKAVGILEESLDGRPAGEGGCKMADT